MKNSSISLFFVTVLAQACGGSVAPPELAHARDAYDAAVKTHASDYAPIQLDDAKKAVERVNKAFKDDEDEDVVKDLAYIAEKKSALATAAGDLEYATRERAKAEKEKQDLQAKLYNSAEAKLDKTERALEVEKEARWAAEKRATAALAGVASVKQEARGLVITLSGAVLFATGKSELLPIARQKLDEVAKALGEQKDRKILIEGYTDSVGLESANEALSLSRAQAVRNYLVSRGLPLDRIRAVGKGESQPVADNATADGRANNRRVEIILESSNPY